MSEHTPGLWYLTDENEIVSKDNLRGHEGVIAQVQRNGTAAETRMNARLIAAAPEMFEALKVARNNIEDCAAGRQSINSPATAKHLLNQICSALDKALNGVTNG
jgi:hypothetical protein